MIDKLRSSLSTTDTTLVNIICKVAMCSTLMLSMGFAQISSVTLNLTNTFDKDANLNSNYRQRYQLMIMGKLLSDNIGDFVFAGSFNDQRTRTEPGQAPSSIPTLWNYNLRSNLLKHSRFPLKLSLVRTRREQNINPDLISSEQYENNDFVSLQGSIPSTGLLPKIVYTTHFSQIANQSAVSQTGKQFSLAINNQSRDVTAGYAMYYSKSNDYNYTTNTLNDYETASFSSFTKLFDKVRITAQANINNINESQSSNGKINIVPDTKNGTRHTISLGLQNQSTPMFSTQSLNLVHSSSFMLPKGKRLGIGTNLSETNSITPSASMTEQNAWMRANFLFNKRIKSIRTSVTLSDRAGAQKLNHHESFHFTNTFSASGRFRWKLNNKAELRGEETFSHNLTYVAGSAIRNSVNIGVLSNLNSNIFVELSVTEGHSMGGTLTNAGTINSRIFRGRSNIKIGRTTVSSIESSLSWSNLAKPLDKAWSSRVTLKNSGLFRGVSTQLSGLYSHQTISTNTGTTQVGELIHFESVTFNANVSARLYAYRLSVRYDYKVSKFNSEDRYFITISRPFRITL